MTSSPHWRYYIYDAVPCRLAEDPATGEIEAEGYFPAGGFQPVSVTPILWYGETVSEKEFKACIAAQSLAARRKSL